MAEQKENEKTSESTEPKLKQASPPAGSEAPNISRHDRAAYWREQDPKYRN